MKIFDFTNGRKGKLLGTTAVVSCTGNWYKPGTTEGWQIGDKKFASYLFTGYTERPLTAEAYGVGAICCCLGKMKDGTGESWEWRFAATDEWIDNQLRYSPERVEAREYQAAAIAEAVYL